MAGKKLECVSDIAYGLVTTSVEWRIRDFFGLPDETHCYIDSPTFCFLGSTWYLRMYPKGATETSPDYLALHLFRKDYSSPKQLVHLRIGIQGRDEYQFMNETLQWTFEEGIDSYGWRYYLLVSELDRNRKEIAPEGVLTVFCIVSANTREGVHAAVQTESVPGSDGPMLDVDNKPLGVDKLANDFKSLFASEEATDVTLNVKNREYKVHRAVLTARSSVLRAMLMHDMKEKNSGLIEINDCDPDAFQQFLMYLYSGNLENISLDTVFGIHSIADKYDAEELKTTCVQFVKVNLNIETFCDALYLALRYNESELFENVVAFFAKNMRSILDTVKWIAFAEESPKEANKLLIKGLDYNANLDNQSTKKKENT